MGGNVRWMAGAIMMDGGSKIAMDSSSGDGQQRRCNWQRDRKAIAMGDGMAVAQWMAQWAADDRHQCRGSAIGGNARWMAATITMDGSSVIAMDGGSGDGQRLQCNGWRDGGAIAMGGETVAA